MREESESGIRKWEEMWFKTTAEDGERGGSSEVWWKTVPQTSGCNRKRSFADSGQTSTSNVQTSETLMRRKIIVVWLQCLLVDLHVVRHNWTLFSSFLELTSKTCIVVFPWWELIFLVTLSLLKDSGQHETVRLWVYHCYCISQWK